MNKYANSYAAADAAERKLRDKVNDWIREECNFIPTAMVMDLMKADPTIWTEVTNGEGTPTWGTAFLTDARNNSWYGAKNHLLDIEGAGFRMWYSEKYDRYLLAFDNTGDAMSQHWLPLYEARQD